jgi:hypothetical protein
MLKNVVHKIGPNGQTILKSHPGADTLGPVDLPKPNVQDSALGTACRVKKCLAVKHF